MKKNLLLILALFCSLSISAQKYWDSSRPNHRLTLGLRAGVNFAKQNNNGDEGADTDFRTGFRGGLEVDLNVVKSLSVNTGAFFVQRGYKKEYSDYRGSLKTNDDASFVEVPLLLSYRVKLSDAAQFQLNFGPYFAFGVSGKQKVTSTFPGQADYEIDSYDEYDGMKKFDCGIHIGAAVVYKNMYIGLCYERGLRNVSNTPNADFKNGCIGINLGYNFNIW